MLGLTGGLSMQKVSLVTQISSLINKHETARNSFPIFTYSLQLVSAEGETCFFSIINTCKYGKKSANGEEHGVEDKAESRIA